MSEVAEFVTRGGVLSFDGRVIEAFGFGYTSGHRVPIALVDGIELVQNRMVGTQIRLDARGGCNLSNARFDLDESRLPELEAWVASVRNAIGAAV